MSSSARIGQVVQGKYRIERVLGEGGMGVVYAARHLKLDKAVAIKLMHGSAVDNEVAVRRFFDEARAAGSLRHPNVIDIVDVDLDERTGAPFMVMEMLEGESLAALLARRGSLGAEELLALLDPVLDGLASAHARGIVHRDLKPDNIFLAREGDTLTPKLLDFGIAKLRAHDRATTATGSIVGTPLYMAPEQAEGLRTIGPAADVWAMGAVYFEALSGRSHLELPPETSLLSILAALATQRPRKLLEVAPQTPPRVAHVIDAALQRAPAQRPASIAAFRAMLRGEPVPGTLAGPPPTVSTVPATITPALATRHTPWEPPAARGGSALIALVVLLAVSLVGGSLATAWWLRDRMRSEEPTLVTAPQEIRSETTGTHPTGTDTTGTHPTGTGPTGAHPTGTDVASGVEVSAQAAFGQEDPPFDGASAAEPARELQPVQGRPRERVRAGTRAADETGAVTPQAHTGMRETTSTRTGSWNLDDL